MFGCLSWCFGGRPEKGEAEKGIGYYDAAQLENDYQQIQRGIAARLAMASAPERIRIRDMLRDSEEQWFPAQGSKEKEWLEVGEQNRKETKQEKGEKKKKKKHKQQESEKDKNSSSSSSSDTVTGPLQAPQLRVMSPMPTRFMPAPPMTAELQPVLLNLPDETKFSSSHGDGDDSDNQSEFCGTDRATEAGDPLDNVTALEVRGTPPRMPGMDSSL
ncbi:hypothetical protein PG994_010702 [Apiospora phragmitis]|uniref:Uncharacterized protein n=1 Tax=Apiospora phragmitis TaxID=2905665 RepID=A0ABR1TQX8_9PEZI